MSRIATLQLATLVAEAPEGDHWLHEQKFDGYRILADKRGDQVKLLSRRFNDWTAKFPSIARAVAALPHDRIVIDGEVAAVMPDGRTRFQALQNALSGEQSALVYYAFDLLELDGKDLASRPLDERKAKLRALITTKLEAKSTLRYSDHVIGNGGAFFAVACKKGLEGIISKRRDQAYSGGRGKSWLKTKCIKRQELVIGGFTEPEGSRSGIGALLVGYYAGSELRYAGKVGTGFSMAMLGELIGKLSPLEQAKSPFAPAPARALTGPRAHWVKPVVVAEVAFGEWTDDGRLRHPSFQGLHLDKKPRDVVREEPVATEPAPKSRRSARAPRRAS